MRLRWLIVAMLFTLGAQSPDDAVKITPEAREAAGRLAKVMGASDMMLQAIELRKGQIADAINKENPGADGFKAMDEIVVPELRKRSGEMTELVVNVWASHFNADELEQLRAFYETPVGRRSLTELPVIMEEARKAGSAWGQQTFQAIFKDRADDLRALGIGAKK